MVLDTPRRLHAARDVDAERFQVPHHVGDGLGVEAAGDDHRLLKRREQGGEGRVVDLVGVCGYYCLVSMTLNVFDMPLPDGVTPPLS